MKVVKTQKSNTQTNMWNADARIFTMKEEETKTKELILTRLNVWLPEMWAHNIPAKAAWPPAASSGWIDVAVSDSGR